MERLKQKDQSEKAKAERLKLKDQSEKAKVERLKRKGTCRDNRLFVSLNLITNVENKANPYLLMLKID